MEYLIVALKLKEIDKIGEIKAAQILAISEIIKRCNNALNLNKLFLTSPKCVMQFLKNNLEGKTQEEIFILVLNVKKHLKRVIAVHQC